MQSTNVSQLTVEVLAKAKQLGADLVGVAPIERFKGAPLKMSPQELLPGAKSVVVMALHHHDAAVELGGDPSPHDQGAYGTQGSVMNPRLDDLSFWMARFLEAKGFQALPIVSSNIWRYHAYKDCPVDFAPDMAHRYAAVAAGLGEIGWNGLALTEDFGPRARFVSVVTNADLTASPMYAGAPLCDKCMACVKHCPTDAFRKEVTKINKLEIGGRVFEFPDINKWRCSWAENFALSLDHAIPDKVDEATALRYLEKYGIRGGEEGYCLKFCMSPGRRLEDPAYSASPRRKKDKVSLTPEELMRELHAISAKYSLDLLAVGQLADFAGKNQPHPEYHLPDVATIISLGLRLPETPGINGEDHYGRWRSLAFAAWEMAHFLDIAGYAAVSHTRIADNPVARVLGVYQPNMLFATVLTSAVLKPHVVKAPAQPVMSQQELQAFCKDAGADLIGCFSGKRLEQFKQAFHQAIKLPENTHNVVDSNWIYGAFYPEIHTSKPRLKGLEDWLTGARSVIVLGLHFPDAALDTAKVNPAESIGPFAFVYFETMNLLNDIAVKVIKRLERSGARAVLTHDLTGLASEVYSSRGRRLDMRANLHAAMLAGLAYCGVNGYPLTSAYGVRQRFIAIVTDYPVQDDPFYNGPNICRDCARPCVKACPTQALKNEFAVVKMPDHDLELGSFNGYACDWAKKYCLVGEEGPAYMGLDVNVPLPKEQTAAAIADAVASVEWGIQKRHLNIAEECLRVCPAHKS